MNPIFALLSLLIGVYINIILLRFFLQYFRADFYNPVSQFVVKATDLLVKPLRKIIPGFAGLDFSTLFLAWVFVIINMLLIHGIGGINESIDFFILFFYSLLKLIQAGLGLFMFLIIIRAVASWISPGGYNPALALVSQLTEPLIGRARKLLPATSGLDLSPMLVLLLIWLIDYSITYYFF